MRVVAFIFLIGIMWVSIAILGRGNPGAANEVFVWAVGLVVAIGVAGAIFSDPDKKDCPNCLETIKWKAVACKYCGRDIPPPKRRTSNLTAEQMMAAVKPIMFAAIFIGILISYIGYRANWY